MLKPHFVSKVQGRYLWFAKINNNWCLCLSDRKSYILNPIVVADDLVSIAEYSKKYL